MTPTYCLDRYKFTRVQLSLSRCCPGPTDLVQSPCPNPTARQWCRHDCILRLSTCKTLHDFWRQRTPCKPVTTASTLTQWRAQSSSQHSAEQGGSAHECGQQQWRALCSLAEQHCAWLQLPADAPLCQSNHKDIHTDQGEWNEAMPQLQLDLLAGLPIAHCPLPRLCSSPAKPRPQSFTNTALTFLETLSGRDDAGCPRRWHGFAPAMAR